MKALGVRELTYKLSFLASSVEPKSARGIADDDEMDDDDDVSACWWHVSVKHLLTRLASCYFVPNTGCW